MTCEAVRDDRHCRTSRAPKGDDEALQGGPLADVPTGPESWLSAQQQQQQQKKTPRQKRRLSHRSGPLALPLHSALSLSNGSKQVCECRALSPASSPGCHRAASPRQMCCKGALFRTEHCNTALVLRMQRQATKQRTLFLPLVFFFWLLLLAWNRRKV